MMSPAQVCSSKGYCRSLEAKSLGKRRQFESSQAVGGPRYRPKRSRFEATQSWTSGKRKRREKCLARLGGVREYIRILKTITSTRYAGDSVGRKDTVCSCLIRNWKAASKMVESQIRGPCADTRMTPVSGALSLPGMGRCWRTRAPNKVL